MAAISFIIVDGYNLIGTVHGDLRAERERLVSRLAAYQKAKGHDITVVFDGWRSGGRQEEKTTISGISVIYSRLADKADLVIKRIISTAGKEWIVITSDRDIMAHAWANGCVPVQSEVFDSFLAGAGASASDEGDDPEDSRMGARKGNPRTLSRKEKAVARALKKL